jgi:hypothetical protein
VWSAFGELDQEMWLTEQEASLVQRFDPAGEQDTIGFFIAAFEKIAGPEHAGTNKF